MTTLALKFPEQARSEKEMLPTMYDLPSENPEEPGVPDQFHTWQPELLSQTFCPPDYVPDRFMVATDMNLYYDAHHLKQYKRPDWYAALDVPFLYEEEDMRLSYVTWQEDIVPFIIVELLSPGTEKEDLGLTRRKSDKLPTKWEVYEQMLGVPYYAVFSRYTERLRMFRLTGGRYAEIDLPRQRVWLPELKLGLGVWHGTYQQKKRKWLRWFDGDGNWIPTPVEKERREKEIAQQQTKKLIAQLKALGIEPDI